MQRPVSALCFCLALFGGGSAFAAEPVRVHVTAAGAQPLGGDQSSQFGTGAAGDATVELPTSARLGFQASAGAVVLSKNEPSKDPSIASTSTGAAFIGTVGLRGRAFGEGHPGGPWIDGNMGVAHTGDVTRPAFDAHLGWDFRVSSLLSSGLDVGPFVGYTQIFQPDTEIRGTDARILTAGLSISLGAKEAQKMAPPKQEEPPKDPVEVQVLATDNDGEGAAEDVCPEGKPLAEDGCVNEIHIFENRILLDDVVHFEFGKAKVRWQSYAVVKRLAKFIIDHDEIVDVSIEGHTDEIGTEEYNQQLSVERAQAMRELLVLFGAPGRQLRITGFGKSKLKIVTLKPEEANRRVELFVTVTRAAESSAPLTAAPHGKSSE
jgi:outer membrane protein OmpA-like peptidoglycan-associated protein